MIYPENADLKLYRGQTWDQDLIIERNGAAVDLTGCTAKAQVRKSWNNSTMIAEMTCTISAAEGKITLGIDAETSAAIVPGRYVYDVKCTDSSNVVTYYITGDFIVNGRSTE